MSKQNSSKELCTRHVTYNSFLFVIIYSKGFPSYMSLLKVTQFLRNKKNGKRKRIRIKKKSIKWVKKSRVICIPKKKWINENFMCKCKTFSLLLIHPHTTFIITFSYSYAIREPLTTHKSILQHYKVFAGLLCLVWSVCKPQNVNDV